MTKTDEPMFPIMGGPKVPWSLIAPYESQAHENHGQSLKQLAGRGGLSMCEAMAVMSSVPYRNRPIANPTVEDWLDFIAERKARAERRALAAAPAPAVSSPSTGEPGEGMAEMAEIALIVNEWRHGPLLSPEALRRIRAHVETGEYYAPFTIGRNGMEYATPPASAGTGSGEVLAALKAQREHVMHTYPPGEIRGVALAQIDGIAAALAIPCDIASAGGWEMVAKAQYDARYLGAGYLRINPDGRFNYLDPAEIVLRTDDPAAPTEGEPDFKARYKWLRDWYFRDGKRSEIHEHGHIERTTPEISTPVLTQPAPARRRRRGMARLSQKQERALGFAKSDVWRSAAELGSTPAACGGLVRRGLLCSVQQREHPLGEKPFFYMLYRITEAGRLALKHNPVP